jgi:hypothetical protein
MNPIFTAANEDNLKGYSYKEFVNQFDNICKEHLETGRAQAFAFIVYDFNSATHEVLKSHGVFTELDRLSGKEITVFYLDGQLKQQRIIQNRLYRNFNSILLKLTNQGIQSIPFIVFFDFTDGNLTNFKRYSIRDDEKFILHDLSKAINEKLKHIKRSQKIGLVASLKKSLGKMIRRTPAIVYVEFIKLLFKDIVEYLK